MRKFKMETVAHDDVTCGVMANVILKKLMGDETRIELFQLPSLNS